MSKFKVGQYVLCTGIGYEDICKGWVGLVEREYGPSHFKAVCVEIPAGYTGSGKVGQSGASLDDKHFVLHTAPISKPSQTTNPFKIGDYVTSIYQPGESPSGYIWTVGDFIGKVIDKHPDKVLVEIVRNRTGRTDTEGRTDWVKHNELIQTLPPVSIHTPIAPKVEQKGCPFKVGDLVTGGPGNAYGVTTGNFVGEVLKIGSVDIMYVKIVRSSTHPNAQYTISDDRINNFDVDCNKFVLYHGPDPRIQQPIKTQDKMSKSSQPQAFMEGVDVVIADCVTYYDLGTEDCIGQVGKILCYDNYSASDGCWVVMVDIQGEEYEVLESELVNYAQLSGKSGKSAPTKKVEKVEAVRKGVYEAPKDIYEPVYKASIDPYKPLGKAELPGVKTFDLAPKKKKRRSIFQSQ